MKSIIKFFGLLIILLGISILFNSEGLYDWAEKNIENIIFYISVIVARLVLGLSLIFAAKESKYSDAIKIFGYLTILGAVFVILIGHNGFQNLMNSLLPIFKPYAPVSSLIGIALGGFLIYAFSMKNIIESK